MERDGAALKEDVQRLVLSAMSRNSGRPSAFLEAQKRLGLDEESYVQLAEMLSREVTDTITFARTAMSRVTGLAFLFQMLSSAWDRASRPLDIVIGMGKPAVSAGSAKATSG